MEDAQGTYNQDDEIRGMDMEKEGMKTLIW
jgi:hypothetical protein